MKASYYDGRSAARHEVEILIADGAVAVSGESVRRRELLANVDVSERLLGAARTLSFRDGAVCEVVESPELQRALEGHGLAQGFVDRMQSSWHATAASLALLVAVGAAAYRFGIPTLATYVADRMPVSVAQQLSGQTMKSADQSLLEPSRLAAVRQAELARRFAALKRPQENGASWPLLFRSSPALGPNAFTLPDGTIVVFDELIALLDTDDQILAVLCHEAGHAHYRHVLRGALQQTALGAALYAWIGDASLLAAVPVITLRTKYSRDLEREADAYAAAMLKANSMSPVLLADALEKLTARLTGGKRDDSVIFDYASTHPSSAERIAVLKAP